MTKIYYSNLRQPELKSLERPRAGTWINVENPSPDDLAALAENYDLELSLLQDAIDVYESPRLEVEEGVIYVFTRFCLIEKNVILTRPILIIHTADHIITISTHHFSGLKKFTDQKVPVLTTQQTKLILQILSEIENSFSIHLNLISKKIWSVRSQLNKEQIENRDFIAFIDIEENLNDILSALVPTNSILRKLSAGRVIKLYEEDEELVEDLALSITELIEQTQSRLKTIVNIREAYSTIMANNLNRIFKLLTSITILMTVPTIVTSIYGMNIKLPLAHNPSVFWVILALITAVILALGAVFKKNRWF